MVTIDQIVVPPFYDNYIKTVNDKSLPDALKKSTKQLRKLLKEIPEDKADFAYAPGKWSLKELLQHIIDAERVFVNRALFFARQDPNALPGFDENNWATNSRASKRNWEDLVDEFQDTRRSTVQFFASLDDEQLRSEGIANNNRMNVAGLGFVCAGHVLHHVNIIRTRYLQRLVELKDKDKKKKKNK